MSDYTISIAGFSEVIPYKPAGDVHSPQNRDILPIASLMMATAAKVLVLVDFDNVSFPIDALLMNPVETKVVFFLVHGSMSPKKIPKGHGGHYISMPFEDSADHAMCDIARQLAECGMLEGRGVFAVSQDIRVDNTATTMHKRGIPAKRVHLEELWRILNEATLNKFSKYS